MLDGTYAGQVETPRGSKTGTVVIQTQGDALTIKLDAPIIGKQTVKGTANGDSFTAQGTLKLLFLGKIDYTVEGFVSNDDLSATIHSSKGDFPIIGVRL